MPTEPKTGMQLPYRGQPGYDEAKAQFPEAYVNEEEELAQMGEMAGDEGPADAADQQIMDMEQDNAEGRMTMMAQSAPMPEKPYSVNAVKTLLKEVNKALDALSGQDMPDLEVEMPSKGAKLEGALPPELYVTLLALAEALRLAGEDFVDKYGFTPEELLSDADLRKVTATIKKMSKDKKLIEAMQAPVEGEGAAPAPMGMDQPSPPGFFDEDEQDLAANMA